VFRNGSSISFVGANSPGGFRRITARIIAFDEVDGYPPEGAGVEGDQITLGTKRSETFWNRKIILGSTPTVKGVSRIEKAWDESDQRRYFVPCPHCGTAGSCVGQPPLGQGRGRQAQARDRAFRVRGLSGCIIEEHDKPWMIDRGEWVAGKPSKGHAGFHIWAGYSLFPNASLGNWSRNSCGFTKTRHCCGPSSTWCSARRGKTRPRKVDGMATSSIFNQTYLDKLDIAIASGALTVKNGEDLVTYRSLAEMLKIRALIADQIDGGRTRRTVARYSGGFRSGC
jgi:hypothetical protein